MRKSACTHTQVDLNLLTYLNQLSHIASQYILILWHCEWSLGGIRPNQQFRLRERQPTDQSKTSAWWFLSGTMLCFLSGRMELPWIFIFGVLLSIRALHCHYYYHYFGRAKLTISGRTNFQIGQVKVLSRVLFVYNFCNGLNKLSLSIGY